MDDDDDDDDDARSPVYNGSPRVLLTIPSMSVTKADIPSYFGVVQAKPSSNLHFSVSVEPDLRFIATYLPEHLCFCIDDTIAGIVVEPELGPAPVRKAALRDIDVDFSADLDAFEREFLLKLANIFGLPSDQESGRKSPSGNPFPISISERRLILAAHNGHSFVSTPNVVSLHVSDKFDSLLHFPGSLTLDHWFSHPDLAVVLALEYTVCLSSTYGLTTQGRKNWFARSLTIPQLNERTRRENEKRITIGWTAWTPTSSSSKAGTPYPRMVFY